jgi:glycine/D-amino acid oxidase-like deaminating enzyme
VVAVISRRHWLRGSLAAALAGSMPACERTGSQRFAGRMLGMPPSPGHRLLGAHGAGTGATAPAPGLQRSARVVVVGAGIAGLAAAYALGQHGVRDVLLIDALDQPGGNSSFGRNEVSAYPWGAHYVPLVRADCAPVLELFADLKIIVDKDVRGLPVYDEYFLSADPQERLWMYGRWQDGLVPQIGATAQDRAQFRAFFAHTEQLKGAAGSDGKPVFAIPVDASSADPRWRALDNLTMAQYLQRMAWNSPLLQWYVNYCCRDDYGCGASSVSAWAGLHYFASRNGLAANADPTTVVTWPEGNGHLAQALAQRGIERVGSTQIRSAVTNVAKHADGVWVDYYDEQLDRLVRVDAAAAILCLPRFVTARVLQEPHPAEAAALAADARTFGYAPWMVANLTLSKLPQGQGQSLAWDNVIYDSPLLGYVVATHQDLARVRGQTVLTYYWPLDGDEPSAARSAAYGRSLEQWQDDVAHDLLRVHPELQGHIENIDVRLWGHGMIRPAPGFVWGPARQRAGVHRPPVYFAHSDLSGISIFEEAYCRGHAAGELAARHLDPRALGAAR